MCLVYYLFCILALIEDIGLDRIQGCKNQPGSNKPSIFISLINTSIVSLLYQLSIYLTWCVCICKIQASAPESIYCKGNTWAVQWARRGLLSSPASAKRPWTFVLWRGHWDFDSLSLGHKGRKCSSIPSPQIIPVSCELEKHVYFLFYSDLPWEKNPKPTVPSPPHGVQWYHNYIAHYFFNWLSAHS